jgi:Trk K+ transport system NAD-binding subunit
MPACPNSRKRSDLPEGSATDEEELLKANLLHAKFLLALTQDEKINIQIAQKATHLYNQFPKKILPNTILQ